MTTKEFNKIRTATYAAAAEIPEIADALQYGSCYIYDVTQLPDLHGVFVLNFVTQMNENFLKDHGFDPDRASVKMKLYLNKKTKCAEF